MKPDLFKDVMNKFMDHESMNMTKPEGEHAAHDGMEGMDMEPRGNRSLRGREENDVRKT